MTCRLLVLCCCLAGLLAGARPAGAQRPSVRADSMQRLLAASRPDTNRVELLIQLAWDRTDDNPLAAIDYGRRSLALARQLDFGTGQCRSLLMLGWAFMRAGNYPTAVQTQLQARGLAERIGYAAGISHADNAIGYAYAEQGNYVAALHYYLRAVQDCRRRRDYKLLTPILGNVGQAYLLAHRPDSAYYYTRLGYQYDLRFRDRHSEIGDLSLLGDVAVARQQPDSARAYYRRSVERARGMPVSYALCRSYLGLARLAQARPDTAAALGYGRQALAASRQGRYAKGVFEASSYLARAYAAHGRPATAYRFLAEAAAVRDSLFSHERMAQVQALGFSEQMHQQELAAEQLRQEAARQRQEAVHQRRLLLAALGALALAVVFTYLLLTRRRLRQQVAFAQERQGLERQRAQAVLAAEEAERRRIGADLHDGLGQLLSAAKLNFSALCDDLRTWLNAEQRYRFLDAVGMLDESVREVRSISHNLVPNALIRRGLAAAVREFVERTQRSGGLRIHFEASGLPAGLDPVVESALYRVVQELVQNAVKHSRAAHLTVQLIGHAGELTLLIEDDGIGFDPRAAGGGIGLRSVQSRVAYLGGTLDVDTRPGRGTTVSATVPARPPQPVPAATAR